MPPRKSDTSKVVVPAVGDEGTPGKEKEGKEPGINIEDLNLPKSIVTRLAKGVLPPNTQIQANAVLAMTKSATVFINYLANQANEHTQASNKRTVSPADVLKALDDLDFGEFKPRLEQELAKFNELATEKRNAYRKRVAAEKAAGTHKGGTPSTAANGEGSTPINDSAEPDSEPAAKKARLEKGSLPEGESADDMEMDEPENENEAEEGEGEVEAEPEEAEEEEEVEGEEAEDNDGEEKEADADEALDNGEDSD